MEENDATKADKLVELLKTIPKERITAVNPVQYAKANESIERIVDFVIEENPDARFEIGFDELTGTSMFLRVSLEYLDVSKLQEFIKAIAPADTMSVCKYDNAIQIAFTYRDVQYPVKPAK